MPCWSINMKTKPVPAFTAYIFPAGNKLFSWVPHPNAVMLWVVHPFLPHLAVSNWHPEIPPYTSRCKWLSNVFCRHRIIWESVQNCFLPIIHHISTHHFRARFVLLSILPFGTDHFISWCTCSCSQAICTDDEYRVLELERAINNQTIIMPIICFISLFLKPRYPWHKLYCGRLDSVAEA